MTWLPLLLLPSAACAPCHREIYDSFRRTPMATSSGVVGSGQFQEDFSSAGFTHAESGFRYAVSKNGVGCSLEFEKTVDPSLHGKKKLAYYVGSGAAARSYLLAADGFLFEAPVAYYTADAKWGLAPGYSQYSYPYLTRPVQPGCLNCHASFLQTVPQTQNRFASPPFFEGGVACERCHSAGEAHIAKGGAAAIVNPSKLSPDRRDAICDQCHLTGEVRVLRPGRDWRSFRPGDRLSDSMTVFVKKGATPGIKVTSHSEKLAQSRCKRSSGDRLWCGTCHDPHSGGYRSKCMECHSADSCAESKSVRQRNGDNCTACHMPKTKTVDAQHVVYTDHSIPRRPGAPARRLAQDPELIPINGGAASAREMGLAYAIAAQREQNQVYRARAEQALPEADDAEALLYLAEIYRTTDRPALAVPLYERANRLDPAQLTGPVGLGAIRMERGELQEAIRLWEDALSKNAGLELVRMNLAIAKWRSGDLQSAESHFNKAIELNPAFAPIRDLLRRLRNKQPAP